jgi:hypothetical protein
MKMNKLEFKISDKKENGTTYQVTQIFIDGQDLIGLLKTYELPFAKKEGSPSIAGGYQGLSPETLFKNLTSHPENHNSEENKSDILDCECGVWGCWSLMTLIEKGEDSITWSDFEQLHRQKDSHNYWDYSKFGPFEFAKTDYENELEKLKNYPQHGV